MITQAWTAIRETLRFLCRRHHQQPCGDRDAPMSFVEQFYNPRLVSHETTAREDFEPKLPTSRRKRKTLNSR